MNEWDFRTHFLFLIAKTSLKRILIRFEIKKKILLKFFPRFIFFFQAIKNREFQALRGTINWESLNYNIFLKRCPCFHFLKKKIKQKKEKKIFLNELFFLFLKSENYKKDFSIIFHTQKNKWCRWERRTTKNPLALAINYSDLNWWTYNLMNFSSLFN